MKEKAIALFYLYDRERNDFITKEEFIKMLFNYPKEEISIFIKEIDNLELSKNNLGPFLQSVVDLQEELSGLDKIKRVRTYSEDKFRDIDFSNVLKEGNFTKNKIKKRILPTTLNNMIKLVADIVFKKYAKGDKLMFEGFMKWVELHSKILEYIEKWFRPALWRTFTDKSGNELLGFHNVQPALECSLQIQKYHSFNKNEAIAKIYDIFLFIFKKNHLQLPSIVIVLTGLDISFKDEKRKIYLNYDYHEYDRLKLKFTNNETYNIWKDYIKQYSNYIVDKKYSCIELIGRGKFSTVHKARNNIDGKFYALKIIKKKFLLEMEKKVLKNEVKIMKVLIHPNIIHFYESCETHDVFAYVLELIKGDDLFEYTIKKKYLSEKETAFIIKNLLEALIEIHSAGIIHRDLKPENIMLELDDENNILKVKIIDFGFAIYKESLNDQCPRVGTKNYIAPEILLNHLYGMESDLFSLGVIMFFLIRGYLPFDSDEEFIIKQKIIDGDYDMENDDFFENISKECKDLIKKLLEPDPIKRINAFEASQHDFILHQKFYIGRIDNKFKKNTPRYSQVGDNIKQFI